MPLITEITRETFDLNNISKGDLIRAKHYTWSEAQNGIVAVAEEKTLKVLYLPSIGNVSNYFTIMVDDVVSGSWEIKWSHDLVTVYTEGIK